MRFPGVGVVETEEVGSGRGSADGGVTIAEGRGGEVLPSEWTLHTKQKKLKKNPKLVHYIEPL